MYTFEKLEIGVGGVAACRHCINPKSQAHPIEKIVPGLKGLENVMLSGFEPFAHPQLVALLQNPALTVCRRLALQTDGGALASAPNAAGSLQAGVSLFEFVLRGGDALSHEQLTGRPGLFEGIRKGISNTRQIADELGHEIFITGLIPICRHNAEYFLSMVSIFTQAGVDAIRVESDRVIAPEEIAAAYEIAIPSGILLFGDYCARLDAVALYNFGGGEGDE